MYCWKMTSPDSSIIRNIKSNIRSWGLINIDYRNYLLCKEVFHCLPYELENETEYNLNLYFTIWNLEKKEEYLKEKRANQK